MSQSFTRYAALIVVLNLLVKTIYLFGVDRGVQNALPTGEYGLYFTLYNFAFIFQIIADFGIQNYNSRELARSGGQPGADFTALLILKIGLSVLYWLLVVGIGGWWGFTDFGLWLLMLVAFNQLLSSLLLFIRSNFSGLGWYRLDSFFSIFDRGLLIIICSSWLWWWPGERAVNIEWFVVSQTVACLLAIAVGGWILKKDIAWHKPQWDKKRLGQLLRASAPYALVVFLMTLYTRLDAIMIERLLPDGLQQADLYASAFRLLDAANIAGYLIAGLLLPMFSRLLAAQESVQPLVRQGFQLLWVGSVALAAICWCYQEPIMRSLYSDGGTYSGQIMGWLMLSFIPMSAAYVHGSLLTAGGKLGQMNIIFALATLLNGTLNLILIPKQGALGAAKATFITQAVVFLAQVLLAVYRLPLTTDVRWLGRLLVYSILVFATTWIWQWAGWTNWFVQALAAGCCALGWAITLGLLDNTILPMLRRVK